MVMWQNFPVETVVGSHLQAAVTMKALDGYDRNLSFVTSGVFLSSSFVLPCVLAIC